MECGNKRPEVRTQYSVPRPRNHNTKNFDYHVYPAPYIISETPQRTSLTRGTENAAPPYFRPYRFNMRSKLHEN
jgi:hypothetical protein